MLEAAMLFIPLLSGYIFSITWKLSRYRAAREDPQRLYFRSAFYGLFLLAYGILSFENIKYYLSLDSEAINQIIFFLLPQTIIDHGKDAYSASDIAHIICVLTLTLAWGACLGLLLNYTFNKASKLISDFLAKRYNISTNLSFSARQFKKIIEEKGDDIEITLLRALEKTMPVLVSMSNRKVYVGLVLEAAEPQLERKNLRLMPLLTPWA